MTLFKLSVNNMKKSVKDYAVYFFTLVLGVAIFYIFNAIGTQSAMLGISKDTREIVNMVRDAISGVSMFVAFVLGFLIIYASRFLMKRRNKEFGLYLLLGMGKRRVSLMLFIETLMIGLVSLAVGLLVGVGLSQLTSAMIANLFKADMTAFRFVFSGEAFAKTCIYFAIIYVVVIVFNTFVISKCRLIDLLTSCRRSEKVRMKNPWVSVMVFVLSVAGFAYSYNQVVCHMEEMGMKEIYRIMALGALCTSLFFWSVSGMLFRTVSSMKNLYFRRLNSFVIRQLSSRINTNVLSISIICLMLFVTICVLASSLAMRDALNDGLKYTRTDVCISRYVSDLEGDDDIISVYEKNGIDVTAHMSEYIEIALLMDENFRQMDTLEPDMLKELYGDDTGFSESLESFMSLSDYNKMAQLCGYDELTLGEDEYAVLANYPIYVELRNRLLAEKKTAFVNGHELKPSMDEVIDGAVIPSTQPLNIGIYIVPDSVAKETADGTIDLYLLGNYDTDDTALIDSYNDELNSIADPDEEQWMIGSIVTRASVEAGSIGVGALVTFIGLYIGFIFLISGAAVLALKELSESTDNIERYRMLRKLGVPQTMIDHALFAQMGMFFIFPLALAAIHSVFGMMCSRKMLELAAVTDFGVPMIFTAAVVVVIYGGYFLITFLCGRKIVRE